MLKWGLNAEIKMNLQHFRLKIIQSRDESYNNIKNTTFFQTPGRHTTNQRRSVPVQTVCMTLN